MKIYCSKNPVSNFIEKMVEEVEYCKKVLKKYFKEEHSMAKEKRDF